MSDDELKKSFEVNGHTMSQIIHTIMLISHDQKFSAIQNSAM